MFTSDKDPYVSGHVTLQLTGDREKLLSLRK